MNYNNSLTVLGGIILTIGVSQLLENGVGWLWLMMVILGTAIITRACISN
jgi:membrane-bound ClpP family serine protease